VIAFACFVCFPAAASADTCPNEQLRTENNSLRLPDCRGYEQVSPQDKNGSSAGDYSGAGTNSLADPFLVGQDGDSALFELNGGISGSNYGGYSSLRSVRTPTGWVSSALAPMPTVARPSAPFKELPMYLAASSDTSSVLFATQHLNKSTFANTGRLDLVDAGGRESPVSLGSLSGPELSAALFAGASSDMTHVFFQTADQLEPTAAGLESEAPMLYERLPASNVTRAVGVFEGGTLATHGAVLGSGGYALGNEGYPQALSRHAVSADGSHVVFSANPTARCDDFSSPCELYDRINGQRTIRISAPQRTSPGTTPVAGTFYQDAAVDGSSVFFLSDGQLTDDDTNGKVDLYRYTFNAESTAGTLTRISKGLGAGTRFDGQLGFVGTSEDGQIVYFVSTASQGAEKGTAGAPNLYEFHDGQVSFVATLSSSDHVVTRAAFLETGTPEVSMTPQARLTPNGTRLVFQSHANLTSFDSKGFAEIYAYTSGSIGPECISCGIVGGIATADASLTDEGNPNFSSVAVLPHNLSDDGNWIFFQSADALVPNDVNRRQDVYQWHEGTTSLISSGQGADPSSFVAASPDDAERDVFFLTSDRLVSSDDDSAFDLYDARIGGGFPVPPTPPMGCSSSCQGLPPTAPLPPFPGSEAFVGPGNLIRAAVGASFSVAKLSSAAVARFARTGKVVVTVRTSAAGSVTVRTSALLRRHWSAGPAVKHSLAAGGTLSATLSLSKRAMTYLSKHKRLSVRIEVSYSGVTALQRTSVALRAPTNGSMAGRAQTHKGRRHA
jgi:hypothetical protein